jgi:hypothetical protein
MPYFFYSSDDAFRLAVGLIICPVIVENAEGIEPSPLSLGWCHLG